jgi:thiamine-phosphate pyrophosphorylase
MVSETKQLRGLYAVTPDDMLLPRLSALVNSALAGGVRLVQYRNKSAPAPLRRAQAAELLRICHAVGAKLIVNDDLALALEIAADGVHLGGSDGDLAVARAALGPYRILGASCYNDIGRAAAAAAAGVDYLAFGAMFASRTRPDAVPAPLSILAEAKRFGLPLAAIGGITLDNAAETISAGADMVAVIADLFDTMDITTRAAEYQDIFIAQS